MEKIKRMENKFSVNEVSELRNELIKGGLDFFQASELIQLFVSSRGYGISQEDVHSLATSFKNLTSQGLKEQLDKFARET